MSSQGFAVSHVRDAHFERLEAGSCVHPLPSIRHREVGHSEDIEMLEVVLPAGFATDEVASVEP